MLFGCDDIECDYGLDDFAKDNCGYSDLSDYTVNLDGVVIDPYNMVLKNDSDGVTNASILGCVMTRGSDSYGFPSYQMASKRFESFCNLFDDIVEGSYKIKTLDVMRDDFDKERIDVKKSSMPTVSEREFIGVVAQLATKNELLLDPPASVSRVEANKCGVRVSNKDMLAKYSCPAKVVKPKERVLGFNMGIAQALRTNGCIVYDPLVLISRGHCFTDINLCDNGIEASMIHSTGKLRSNYYKWRTRTGQPLFYYKYRDRVFDYLDYDGIALLYVSTTHYGDNRFQQAAHIPYGFFPIPMSSRPKFLPLLSYGNKIVCMPTSGPCFVQSGDGVRYVRIFGDCEWFGTNKPLLPGTIMKQFTYKDGAGLESSYGCQLLYAFSEYAFKASCVTKDPICSMVHDRENGVEEGILVTYRGVARMVHLLCVLPHFLFDQYAYRRMYPRWPVIDGESRRLIDYATHDSSFQFVDVVNAECEDNW